MGDLGDSVLREIEVRPIVLLKPEPLFAILSRFSCLLFAILEIKNAGDQSRERDPIWRERPDLGGRATDSK
jgi:hypothetical protein